MVAPFFWFANFPGNSTTFSISAYLAVKNFDRDILEWNRGGGSFSLRGHALSDRPVYGILRQGAGSRGNGIYFWKSEAVRGEIFATTESLKQPILTGVMPMGKNIT
jgi:hypothetical protein